MYAYFIAFETVCWLVDRLSALRDRAEDAAMGYGRDGRASNWGEDR